MAARQENIDPTSTGPTTGPSATAPRTGGTPDGMSEQDVRIRSALAAHLGRDVYPADRDALQRTLRENTAPDALLELIARLPDDGTRYANVQEIATALGLGTEQHRN